MRSCASPCVFELRRRREQCKPAQFQTKIEVACELIGEAVEKLAVKASVVLFDSWYLCQELTQYVKSVGLDWISEAKSNATLPVRAAKHESPGVRGGPCTRAEQSVHGGEANEFSRIWCVPTEAFWEAEIYGRPYWYFTRCLHTNEEVRRWQPR